MTGRISYLLLCNKSSQTLSVFKNNNILSLTHLCVDWAVPLPVLPLPTHTTACSWLVGWAGSLSWPPAHAWQLVLAVVPGSGPGGLSVSGRLDPLPYVAVCLSAPRKESSTVRPLEAKARNSDHLTSTILLLEASKASPNSRGGEMNSTSG